jgi:5-methylcytosine-specific restriction endonuclease McrA
LKIKYHYSARSGVGQPFFKKSKWKFPEYCGGNKADWRMLSEECKRRDGYKCTQCGAKGWQAGGNATLQAHHIVSKSKGGLDIISNLETVCTGCHSKHHDHMKGKKGI